MKRALVVTRPLSAAALFELSVQQPASAVLDLRPLANGAAPVLGLIYHRPTRLTLARTVRRLFEHDPPADRLVLVLVEPAQTAELDAVLHRVCPQIQIDWLDSVRTKEHDGTH